MRVKVRLWRYPSSFTVRFVEYKEISVTRLGDFYKFLTTNCPTKVAQIFWWLFGPFCNNVTIMWKVSGYFLGNFRGKLVNFIFHHLVTLKELQASSCSSLLGSVGLLSFWVTLTLPGFEFLLFFGIQVSLKLVNLVLNTVDTEII